MKQAHHKNFQYVTASMISMVATITTTFILASASHADSLHPDSFKMPSSCIMMANQQLADGISSMGFGPANGAIQIDAEGKTQILDKDAITKRETKDNVETITYKIKVMAPSTQKRGRIVQLDGMRTIVIRRDGRGQLISMSKVMDIPSQLHFQEAQKKFQFGIPKNQIVRSIETSFTQRGDQCKTEQVYGIESADKVGPTQKKVYYDKKLCDSIKPNIDRIGSNNAAECSALLMKVQNSLESRMSELKSEDKEFKLLLGQTPQKLTPEIAAGHMNLAGLIQSCIMNENPFGQMSYMEGMHGMAPMMYSPAGGGFGGIDGAESGGVDKPASKRK